ncbi:MAG: Ig-like domain-containing protein, partial [Lachnospiraceae bacterium]|nr:Ig-like domain-containing protein [Lachnospiraceae bacterium]
MYKWRKKAAAGVILFLLFQNILGCLPVGLFAGSGKDAGGGSKAEEGVISAYAAPGDPTGTPTPAATPGAGDPSPTPVPWWGEGEAPEFYMINDSQPILNGQEIRLETKIKKIGIGNRMGYFPADAVLAWQQYDARIISIKSEGTEGGAGAYTVELEAVGPGYTSLAATITYQGKVYYINCQIHVPLELLESTGQINSSTPAPNRDPSINLGMLDSLKWGETENKKTIQLRLEDPNYSHYLPMFKYVNYAENVNSFTANTNPLITGELPAWDWESSNPEVVTVDQYGYIQAVGAGYAEVTVTTKTTVDTKKGESKTFGILVEPSVQLPDSQTWNFGTVRHTANSSSMTIHTNALIADSLVWSLYRGTAESLSVNEGQSGAPELLNLEKNNYMQVNISKIGDGVTLSDMKAGIYCLVARPTDFYDMGNPRVGKLVLEITVPLIVSESAVVMNVGDIYNILGNTNTLDKTLFSYVLADDQTCVKVEDGIVTGMAEGSTKLTLQYRGDKDIFWGRPGSSGVYKDTYEINVTVIDGIALNMTTATIYTDSTLQLSLNTSNNSAPITWVSSDPSILTVDENGLVRGVKEGNAVVTVTQTINGVTKMATCRIRVVGSVTSIKLDPEEKDIAIGDLLTINAIVTPKLNQVSLHWVTSNASIVTIEQSGDLSTTVKAVAGGTAVITAINQNNVVVGSCLIRVKQPIVSIKLSQTNVTVPLSSKELLLYATISPDGAKNEEIVWKSTDPSIATVDQFGKVTIKKPGKTSIICSAKADGNISAICNVTVTQEIAVRGIKLDKTVLNMYAGETYRMTYVLSPDDATNKNVTWMSTNPAIATVDARGLISAKSVGQTAIILKTADGGYMSTCLVNVSKVATAVKLDINTLTLNVGDYYSFETTITPADSTETTLVWETSDKSVAIISNKGKVTAKKAGVAIILAKTKSGSTAYCTVTVQQGVTSVKLDSHEETIRVDDVIELVADVKPANATVQKVVWSSSNNSVASVDDRGRVTGKHEGVAIITCTSADGGYVDYCAVIVLPKLIEITDMKLIPESYRLGVGKTYKLEVEVSPSDASNKEFEWSSSNPRVVTVDQKGRIRGIS